MEPNLKAKFEPCGMKRSSKEYDVLLGIIEIPKTQVTAESVGYKQTLLRWYHIVFRYLWAHAKHHQLIEQFLTSKLKWCIRQKKGTVFHGVEQMVNFLMFQEREMVNTWFIICIKIY